MNFKKWDEVSYFSCPTKLVISSFNSMILAFKDIRMVWCLDKNSVMFSLTTVLQSSEWSRWFSIRQSLQIKVWCFLQNFEATYSGWLSQNMIGSWKFFSICFLTYLLGKSLTGPSKPSCWQWSKWQKEQSNWPFITSSLLSLFIMRVSTHSLQAVSLQHIKLIGSLFLRLKKCLQMGH